MTTEAQRRALKKYASKTVQIMVKLNLKTDADIIQKLSSEPNKQGYIKRLIRAEIARKGEC